MTAINRKSWAARLPTVVFATICFGAMGSIYYAHYQQVTEKQKMRDGVIRDIKRDRLKRKEMAQAQAESSAHHGE